MKISIILISMFVLTACSTAPYPLISKQNCSRTCEIKGMELQDFDTDDGCYCKAHEE